MSERVFSSPEELKAHYAAIQRRFATAGPPPKKTKQEIETERIKTLIEKYRLFAYKPARRTAISIWEEVAAETGLTVELLKSHRRHPTISHARFKVWSRLQVECPHMSLPAIGKMSGHDHTSVLHGIRRYREMQAAKAT